MDVGKYIRETSVLKTLRFNLHYFGLPGLKLPVLVSRNYRLNSLGGHVEISKLSFGSVRLGYSSVGIVDRRDSRGIWQVGGKICFRGSASLGSGSKVSCAHSGVLSFGDNFVNTSSGAFVCHNSLTFGDNCLVSWDTLFMDTDFHSIEGSDVSAPISVGDHCWICCGAKVLKGAGIPDGSVVAASAIVTKRFEAKRALLVGYNKVAKNGVKWNE